MKKTYIKPQSETESIEQTSLACNSTINLNVSCANEEMFAPGAGDCNIDVAKGGHYATIEACQYVVEGKDDVVGLS